MQQGFQSVDSYLTGVGHSPDGIGGYGGLGVSVALAADELQPQMVSTGGVMLRRAWAFAAVAGTAAGVYHGYKRNDSIGWALLWGFLGGIAPVITVPVALAQGFGKKKGR